MVLRDFSFVLQFISTNLLFSAFFGLLLSERLFARQSSFQRNIMGMNARNRRSTWDNNKEENRLSDRTSEQNARQERESYLRNLGRDPKSYDQRDSYDTSRSRRPGDMAKSYPVSPRNHGPGQQNHIRSPEGTWEHSRRSRSRSRGRARGRSRSPSGSRNRSRSLSRGRERERDRNYGRSRSPLNDNRRNLHGGFNDKRGVDGRRGSQGRHNADNFNPRDRGRPERDHQGKRGVSRYDVEREDPARNSNLNVAPCKYFMMGDCSKSNCRFAHDAPMQNTRESGSREDRRDHDFSANNRKWTGPTWEEVEEKNAQPVVRIGGWSGPTWDDVAAGSECKSSAMKIKSNETSYDVELNRSNDESKYWTGPESNDVDMDIAKPETPKEITKMEPNVPYEFSKPTSTVAHSVFPENAQIYSKMEGNISIGNNSDCVDGENDFGNVKQNNSKSGHDFIELSDAYSLPPQQFGGIGQAQFVDFELNGPVENSIDNKHVHPVKLAGNGSVSQAIESENVQISNIPPSLTEEFVNEQLPQLYAVLNPPKLEGSMPPVPDSANPVSIYQKRNGDDKEPEKLENIDRYPDISSKSVSRNGDYMNSNRISSPPSHKKTSPKSASEEPSKPIAENNGAENNGAENVDADTKVEDGATWKDDKAMRLFKNSLVEFVKDILKPKWKEGGMSKDVHKAIVKKVVDKVTSATQGANIPSTQAKLDHYFQCSKPKLAKLVEAYVERCSKTS